MELSAGTRPPLCFRNPQLPFAPHARQSGNAPSWQSRPFAPYLMNPLLRRLAITALGYGENLNVGISTCPDLLPDPWYILDLVEKAHDELVALSAG